MRTQCAPTIPLTGLVCLCASTATVAADDGNSTGLLRQAAPADASPLKVLAALEVLDVTAVPMRDVAGDDRLRRAVADFLQQIDEIEQRAAQERAAARARLEEALRAPVSVLPARNEPGLIGGSTINGEKAGIVYRYHHGRLLAADDIRSRFHTTEPPFPDVRIELVGYVDVPRDMTVKIWHAAGGVNNDHGELTIDDRLIGTVGDDLVKNMIYVVKLPQGTHRVRWVLTGGTFQNNLLKFEDPQTGTLLEVFHDAGQREASGVDSAREIVEGNQDPAGWSIAVDPRQWSWETVAW
jgi:hypothetical protein